MLIVFHGAETFYQGAKALMGPDHDVRLVSGGLEEPGEAALLEAADVVVGAVLNDSHPFPENARLYQVVGAGFEAVDFSRLPADCEVCNCFGHEGPMAEYVIAALMMRHLPFADADKELRSGNWKYAVARPNALRSQWSGSALGLIGFGHIGKAIAERARPFGVDIHAANRSDVSADPLVDHYWPLEKMAEMCGAVDAVVVSLPLNDATRSIVGKICFDAMRPDGVIVNVGRGPVIDEQALYEALHERRIGGAIIDTWYRYPTADDFSPLPSDLPFHELDNVVMTPHMSGWTTGTVRHREKAIAENVARLAAGEPRANVVRAAG